MLFFDTDNDPQHWLVPFSSGVGGAFRNVFLWLLTIFSSTDTCGWHFFRVWGASSNVFLWPLTMISSTGTCGWRRCRTSPQGNRRPRRSLNKHSDFLNKHLRLSKYEDIKIWGWWRFKKFSPNLHWPSSRSQYCNTGINICLEILISHLHIFDQEPTIL